MSFTNSQQGLFRPMVSKAWLAHAEANGFDPRSKAAKDTWYRAELRTCLGHDTTKDANTGRDFDTVMAHFESFIFGEIYWNLRVMQGDTRRILHAIQTTCTKYDFDDAYARSVAVRVLKWEGYLTCLKDITDPADLSRVRIALIKQGRRAQKRAEQAAIDPATTAAPDPARAGQLNFAVDAAPSTVETSFESEGIAARKKAAAANTRKLIREAQAACLLPKPPRAKRKPAPSPTEPAHATVDPSDIPF